MNIRSKLIVLAGTVAVSMATVAQAENPEHSGFTWDEEAKKLAAVPGVQPTFRSFANTPLFRKFSLQPIAPSDPGSAAKKQSDTQISRRQREDAEN